MVALIKNLVILPVALLYLTIEWAQLCNIKIGRIGLISLLV